MAAAVAEDGLRRGDQVRAIQRAVIGAGIYLVGGADGIFGRYTTGAVRTFQTARGLPVNGVVDEPTAVAMGLYTPPAATAAATVAVAVESTTTTTTTVADDTATTTVAVTRTAVELESTRPGAL